MPVGVYIRTEKTKKALSNSLMGRSAWNKGIKIDKKKYPKMGHNTPHTEETKIKMSVNHKGRTGKINSEEHRKKISGALKGKKHINQSGEKHWNWKGGKIKYDKRVRGQIEYKIWRDLVYERDNWTCQKCLIRGVELNPHHILNYSDNEDLRFNIDNGITFCRKCHYHFHKKYGFKNNNGEQVNNFLNK